MAGFALNLNLTSYFDDLRGFSSVFVDPAKCKDVGDVEKHIKSIFKLEDNICLTNRKFLIPRNESLKILQLYETVEVQKCDFFDQQIHKNKRSNPASDQIAMNLIQSERTIDLSCRPKQRLQINICQNHLISGATFAPFVESGIIEGVPLTSSSDVCCVPCKEKHKNKKKKHDITNDNEDLKSTSVDDDILDMSVQKSKKNKNENCFSGVFEMEHALKKVEQNRIKCVNVQDNLAESDRKCKKRKKYSRDNLEDNNDNTGGSVLDITVSDNGKKHKKKSKKSSKCTPDSFKDDTVECFINNEIQFQDEDKDNHSSTLYEGSPVSRKHKKVKRYADSEQDIFVNIDSQKYEGSSNTKQNSPVEVKNERTSTIDLDEYKRIVKMQADKLIEKMKHGNVKNSDVGYHQDTATASYSSNSNTTDVNESEKTDNLGNLNVNNKDISIKENDLTLDSELLKSNTKRKRVRRHNKKKKRERDEFLSAVGPVLNNLIAQPVYQSPTVASNHVFFTEGDVEEDLEIPSTPKDQPKSSKGSSVSEVHGLSEVLNTDKLCGDRREPWQHQLLKLASSSSKPIVFQRSDSDVQPSIKTELPLKPSDHDQENANSNAKDENINKEPKDYKQCNGEVKTDCDLNVASSSVTLNTRRIDAMDNVRPILTDVQNIIVSDYPVIDKVVTGDLILFKVLKLNENNEPGMSKTILARVNSSTDFPDKIHLHIMEGSEECDPFNTADENNEECAIEMRWADMIEPRLLYP